MSTNKIAAICLSFATALLPFSAGISQPVYAAEQKTAVEATEESEGDASDLTGYYYGNFQDTMEYELYVRSQNEQELVIDLAWYNMRVAENIETTTIVLDENNTCTFAAPVFGGHGADGSALDFTISFDGNTATLLRAGNQIDFVKYYSLSPDEERLWDIVGNYESEDGKSYTIELYSSPEPYGPIGIVYEDEIPDMEHATEYSETPTTNVYHLNTDDNTKRYMIIYTDGDTVCCDWYTDGELIASTVRVESWGY